MEHLSIEKQLTHRYFCDALKEINDADYLRSQLCQLHLLYLGQQTMFAQIAKEEFSSQVKQKLADKRHHNK